MNSKLLSMMLAAGSVTAYHIAQRLMPRHLHPMGILLAAYLIAGGVCMGLWRFLPGPTTPVSLSAYAHPVVGLLGLAIVGLELGFMWAYRAGWHISLASITATSLATVLLLVIGLVFFREGMTWQRAAGLVACCVGVALLTKD